MAEEEGLEEDDALLDDEDEDDENDISMFASKKKVSEFSMCFYDIIITYLYLCDLFCIVCLCVVNHREKRLLRQGKEAKRSRGSDEEGRPLL